MNPNFPIWFGISALIHVMFMLLITAVITVASPPISNSYNPALTVDFISTKINSPAKQLTESVSVSPKEASANKISNATPPDSSFKKNVELALLPLVALPLPQPKYYTINELDQAPQIIEKIDENPPELLNNPEGGSLTLQLKIDETGNTIQVKILESNLPNEFAESATHSFMQKKFSPGLKDSVPVNSILVIVVNYSPTTEVTNKQP